MSAKGNKCAEKRERDDDEGNKKKKARKIKFKIDGKIVRKSLPDGIEVIKVCGQQFPLFKDRPYISLLESLVSITSQKDWVYTAKSCHLCMEDFDETTKPAVFSCHPLCKGCYEKNRAAAVELGFEHDKVPEYKCPFCRSPNLVEPIFMYEGGDYTEDRSIEVLVSNVEEKTYHVHGIHDGKRFIGQCVLDHSKGWQEGLSYHIGEFHKLNRYLVCMTHLGLNTKMFQAMNVFEYCVFQGAISEASDVFSGLHGFNLDCPDVFYGSPGFDYKKPDMHEELGYLYEKHMDVLEAVCQEEELPSFSWDKSTVISLYKNWFGKVKFF